MTLVDLANIGQAVGSLAVVASLVFVGLQVRQNTKANKATTLQMNADYWLTYLTTLADKRFSDLYSKGALGREELDGGQFGQFFILCRATFMGCENQHYQFRAGLLDEDAYRGYEATIGEQIAAFPGVRAMWQLVKHTYGNEFAVFLDKQIASMDAHNRGSIQKQWRELVKSDKENAAEQSISGAQPHAQGAA